VQIDELRAQSATADLIEKMGKSSRAAMLAGGLPPCVRSIVSDAEWIVYGAPAVKESGKGTMVIRGRWKRKDVETCMADAAKPHVAKDGARLYRLGDTGWLDFVDDHTAYAAIRDDLEAEAVHALARHGAGPKSHARELLARLPADRTFTIVVDGHARDDWSDTLPIPTGSDVFGWFRVDPEGVALDIAVDTHNELTAKSVASQLAEQLASVFKRESTAIAQLAATRDKTTVHLQGTMSSLMISLAAAALDR
jgi:hypothetical protein